MDVKFILKMVGEISAYWCFFSNAVYILRASGLISPKYNRYLDVVSYRSAMNFRSLIMKGYRAAPEDAPLQVKFQAGAATPVKLAALDPPSGPKP